MLIATKNAHSVFLEDAPYSRGLNPGGTQSLAVKNNTVRDVGSTMPIDTIPIL